MLNKKLIIIAGTVMVAFFASSTLYPIIASQTPAAEHAGKHKGKNSKHKDHKKKGGHKGKNPPKQ